MHDCKPIVSVGLEDKVTFNRLPEQIRRYYREHSMEYSTTRCSAECSTWVFYNVWLRECPEQHLPPHAVLQFSPVPGKLWIDCWDKASDGDWALTHSNQIEG